MTLDERLRIAQHDNELRAFLDYERRLNLAYARSQDPHLDDGCVRVQVGEYVGTVSSMHLVEPKVKQLMSYWTLKNNFSDIDQAVSYTHLTLPTIYSV